MWTTLYILMGVASYRVYQRLESNSNAKFALQLYAAKLALNFAWSPLFFRAHAVGASVLNVVDLLGMTIWTGVEFYKVDHVAGYLFVPYAGWVAIATALNISIFANTPSV